MTETNKIENAAIRRSQLAGALPFAARDARRYPPKSGVRVRVDQERTVAEAMNGRALVRVETPRGDDDTIGEATIPPAAVKSTLKALGRRKPKANEPQAGGERVAGVSVNGTTVVEAGESRTECPNLEGHYPPTDEAWPTGELRLRVGLGVDVLEGLVKSLKAAGKSNVTLEFLGDESVPHLKPVLFHAGGEGPRVRGLLMPFHGYDVENPAPHALAPY